MNSIIEIIESLNKILSEKEPVRKKVIKSLQDNILDDENVKDEILNEILTEIAYDLDFYEANEEWRKENSSYYSSDRLEKLVKEAIRKLDKYKDLMFNRDNN